MLRFLPVLFVVFALGAAFLVERVVKPRADNLAGLTENIVEPAKLQVGIVLARVNRLMAPDARFDYGDFTPEAPAGWEKRPYHISDRTELKSAAQDWGIAPNANVLKLQKQLAQIQSRGNKHVQEFYSNGNAAVLLDVKTVKASVFDGINGGAPQDPGPVFAQIDGVIFYRVPVGPDEAREFTATLGGQAQITVTARASDGDVTSFLNAFDMTGLRQAIGVPGPEDAAIADAQLTTASGDDAEPAAPIAAPITTPVQSFRLSGAKATNKSTLGLGGCRTAGAGKFCKVGGN